MRRVVIDLHSSSRTKRRRTARMLPAMMAGAGFALAIGCASTTSSPTPPIQTDAPFSRSGEVVAPADWWSTFDDAQLNALMDQAFEQNLDLAASWERVRAARAVARRESAGLFPSVDGFLGAEWSRSPSDGETDFLQAGFAAAYEVDLWGRVRAAVDAEEFRAEATRSDYEATALTLSGEVALTWYRLVETVKSEALVREQIEANTKVLRSLMNRFQRGQARSVDVLRQEQLLEATRERLIVIESEREVLVHQLAVLLGQPPQSTPEWTITELPELPPPPATGLPSDLLLRRPDVRIAFNQLRAADRDLAVAVSARYPRLNLAAGLSTTSQGASQLFEDWSRSVAAELVAPVIDGGARRAEVERAEAVKRQRLAGFGRAGLVAFREVEDALTREVRQRDRIDSLRRQVELQTRAYEKLRAEYFNGVSDYIDVLTAQTEAQQLRRDLVVAERELIEYRIALHRALAGPVPHPQPELFQND